MPRIRDRPAVRGAWCARGPDAPDIFGSPRSVASFHVSTRTERDGCPRVVRHHRGIHERDQRDAPGHIQRVETLAAHATALHCDDACREHPWASIHLPDRRCRKQTTQKIPCRTRFVPVRYTHSRPGHEATEFFTAEIGLETYRSRRMRPQARTEEINFPHDPINRFDFDGPDKIANTLSYRAPQFQSSPSFDIQPGHTDKLFIKFNIHRISLASGYKT